MIAMSNLARVGLTY